MPCLNLTRCGSMLDGEGVHEFSDRNKTKPGKKKLRQFSTVLLALTLIGITAFDRCTFKSSAARSISRCRFIAIHADRLMKHVESHALVDVIGR